MEIDLSTIDLQRREENIISSTPTSAQSARTLTVQDTNGPNGLICVIKNLHQSFSNNTRVRPPLFSSVAFNCTGEYAAAVDEKGSTYLFHLLSPKKIGISLACELESKGACIRFNPQRADEFLVSTQDKRITCFSRVDGVYQETNTLQGHKRVVHSITFHVTLNIVATASLERLIVWNTTTWKRVKCLGGGTGIIQAEYTPKGDLILVAFKNNYKSSKANSIEPSLAGCAIIGWGAQSFDLLVKLKLSGWTKDRTEPHVQAFAVSPDSKSVIAGGDGLVFIWTLHTQELVRVIHLPGSVQRVLQVDCLKGLRMPSVAVLGDDGVVRILQHLNENCSVEHEFNVDAKAFLSYAIAPPEGRFWMCSVSDGSLNVLDMRSARRYRERIRQTRVQMGLIKGEATDAIPLASHPPTTSPNQPETDAVAQLARTASNNSNRLSKAASPRRSPKPKRVEVAGIRPLAATSTTLTPPSPRGRHEEKHETVTRREESLQGQPQGHSIETGGVVHESLDYRKGRTVSKGTTVSSGRPVELDLELHRVLKLLKDYGEFPERYRLLIWTFLLRLPRNVEAFNTLVAYGTHPDCVDLYQKFPVKSLREFGYLEKVVSALAHWCPVLAEADFIACLFFPFVKVFARDELVSFETCMCLILHWCSAWFENFPHPPIRTLTVVERVLEIETPKLYQYLMKCGVTGEVYAWPLLRSALSEVLSRTEWLRLWDNIFGSFDRPELLLAVVAAYSVYFSSTLLTLNRKEDFERFYRRQNAIDLAKVLSLAKGTVLRKYSSLFAEIESTGVFPIEQGSTYPAFERYPRFAVDARLMERERIAAEEEELARKKDFAEQVKAKGLDLEKQDRAWAQEQTRLAELEMETLKTASDEEKNRLKEVKRVNALIRQRKLDNVLKLQSIAEENLKLQKKVRELEHERMKADVGRSVEQMKVELAEKLEDEAVEQAETDATLQLREMHLRHQAAQELQNVRLEAKKMSAQFELERTKLAKQIEGEDEFRSMERDKALKTLELDSQRHEIEALRLELQSTALKAKREIEEQKQTLLNQRARRVFHEQTSLNPSYAGQTTSTDPAEETGAHPPPQEVAPLQEVRPGIASPQSQSTLSTHTDLDTTLPLEKKVERLLQRDNS